MKNNKSQPVCEKSRIGLAINHAFFEDDIDQVFELLANHMLYSGLSVSDEIISAFTENGLTKITVKQ